MLKCSVVGLSKALAPWLAKLIVAFCLKESDAMTDAIKELSRTFPSLAKHLIAERDLYMVGTVLT